MSKRKKGKKRKKIARSKPYRRPKVVAAGVGLMPTSTEQPESEQPQPPPEQAPYDETLLECARTQWQFGDWERLAELDPDSIRNHPERAKLALLVAAAQFQLGETNEAHRYLRMAQDWGCSRRLIAQILISGAHNALGCARLLLGAEEQAAGHFYDAVRLGGVLGDARLLTEARRQTQRTKLNIERKEA